MKHFKWFYIEDVTTVLENVGYILLHWLFKVYNFIGI